MYINIDLGIHLQVIFWHEMKTKKIVFLTFQIPKICQILNDFSSSINLLFLRSGLKGFLGTKANGGKMSKLLKTSSFLWHSFAHF